MHSLKNTVVAVGLLGLSFVFYQLSSSKPTDSGLIAPLTALQTDESPADEPSDDLVISPLPEELPVTPEPVPPKMDKPSSPGSSSPAEPIVAPPAPPTGMGRIQQQVDGKDAGRGQLEPPGSLESPITSQERDRNLIGLLETVPRVNSDSTPNTGHEPFQAGDPQFNPNPPSSPESHPAPAGGLSMTPLPQATFPESLPERGANGFDPGVVKAGSTSPAAGQMAVEYANLWPSVEKLVEAHQFRDALQLLSRFYHSPEMTEPERKQLLGWLDALAGKVIFSEEHFLSDGPYSVAPMESLADIAQRWQVPREVIYNINQSSIPNPAFLQPGTHLKMVPGPFHAEIDRQRNTMTLFLGDLYAVQFPVRIGISGTVRPGEFGVIEKNEAGFEWRDATGKAYGPSEPENGYGPYWIGIDGYLCIHAISDDKQEGHNGCIGLSPVDAKDVFGMLSSQSKVTIR